MLNFANVRLCGRETETATLHHVYKRSTNGSSQVVWIKGRSGSGKSVLVENVFGQHSSDYLFCMGKFEQQSLPMPHSALAKLLSKLWYIIESDYPDIQLRSDDLTVLSNLVPEMNSSVKVDREKKTVACNPEWELERLKQALRSFVKQVCCKVDSPLIMYLDDLQWADLDTLSVVEDLLSDPEQTSLLFIGSYRDNEVTNTSALTHCINNIYSRRPQCITEIHITNLDQSALGELVAGLLCVTQNRALPLSKIIHQKTEGNCFYALLMIRHIYDQRLIHMSKKTYRWEWDLEKIRVEVAVSDNVVDLLGQKLASLPTNTLNALKISAFLGSRINVALLAMMLPLLESDDAATTVHDVLDAAVQANLIEMDPDQSHFTFSHDRIEATIYATAAEEKMRQLLHLRIGRFLRSRLVEENDWHLYLATDQLNRGSKLIVDGEERLDLARLNVIVAKRLVRRGAFQMSLTYLKVSVAMLGTHRWEQNYDSTLDLSNTLASVLLSNGKTDECIHAVEEVRLHAKRPEDKYVTHLIYIEMLASTNRLDECLTFGLGVLREVGYPKVPRKPSLIRHIIPKLMAVKRVLQGMSDKDLLDLPPLLDKNETQRFIFDIFSSLMPVAYFANETDLIPVIACNIMQQNLLHGATPGTGGAFAGYGVLLSILNDFDGAMRFATLAKGFMARFGDDPRCLFVVHALLMHLKNPMQASVGTTLTAYQMAFSKGDLRYAGQAAYSHIQIRLAAGLPLASLADDGFAFCRQLQKYDQQVMYKLLLVTLRAVVEMMDRSSDMSEFVGEALDDHAFEENINNEGATATHIVHFWAYAMEARFYLGDMDSALGFAKKVWKSKALDQGAFVNMVEYHLVSALVALHWWRATQTRRFIKIFRKHQKVLVSWAKKGNVNTLHLVALLEAEVAVDRHSDGDCTAVRRLYEKAILIATRCGFVHHAALANELVGKFCLRLSSPDLYWARFYLSNARDLYDDWNATSKVCLMDLEYNSVLEPDLSTNKSTPLVCESGGTSVSDKRRSTTLTGRSRAAVIVQTETTHAAATWTIPE